jgi:acetylornithine deacetylase/succinyl-diaminopimelate desuccinylase-like protein
MAAFCSTVLTLAIGLAAPVHADALTADQRMAVQIYKELIEINTVADAGDTGRAADAMAGRLLAAGFSAADVQVFKPAPDKGNLVARLRGTGARRPVLLLAHLDVVAANPKDWSLDPFTFVERDGYYYGRGTSDDKYMAATWVANLIRYKKEGYTPDRDIIVVLETDEEIGDRHAVGIRWLLKNHRNLIDAEYALNEGGGVAQRSGKPYRVNVAIDEKLAVNYALEVLNKGGHSSLPIPDNAIYHLAEGLARLSRFAFPINLTAATRASFEHEAEIAGKGTAADIRLVLSGAGDPEAAARLSARPSYNAALRTTCVTTMLAGGHATNALPQAARATINCRIMPGESPADIQATLVRVLADDKISVTQQGQPIPTAPSAINGELLSAIEKTAAEFWPGVPVVPVMAAGATDGKFLRNAGIPTYGHSGLVANEVRAHGRDERVAVKSFFEGGEYLYRLVKRISGGN